MAYANTTTGATFARGRIAQFVTTTFNTVADWNDARITRKSLSKLSARELEDIGLSVSDIDSVATRSFR